MNCIWNCPAYWPVKKIHSHIGSFDLQKISIRLNNTSQNNKGQTFKILINLLTYTVFCEKNVILVF
jgi:hypothetical protein